MSTTRIQTTAIGQSIRDISHDINRLSEEERNINTRLLRRGGKFRAKLEEKANGIRATKNSLMDQKRGLEVARETVLGYERLSLAMRECLAETEEK